MKRFFKKYLVDLYIVRFVPYPLIIVDWLHVKMEINVTQKP